MKFYAYLSPLGWPGIYSGCFSQLDGDKDSLLLDERFYFLIAVRLIRDNYKAVIENFSTSLIGGDLIRFIRYGLFGLSVLSALGMDELDSRFGPAPGAGPFYWVYL